MKSVQNKQEGIDLDNKISFNKRFGLLYSFVLIGSAVLILILFEDFITINLYIVYLAIGLILGLSIVLLLHLFLKRI